MTDQEHARLGWQLLRACLLALAFIVAWIFFIPMTGKMLLTVLFIVGGLCTK